MTSLRTVRHLVKFDLVRARWMIAGYVVLVFLATLMALNMLDTNARLFLLFPLFSWIVGGGIALTVVQYDAPMQSNAFWASRPIPSWTLLTAKITTVALAVLAPPLLGQTVVLLRFASNDTPLLTFSTPFISLLFSQLVTSAALYAGWLLLCMLIGAVTRGAYAAFGVVVAGLTGFALLMSVAPPWLRALRGAFGSDFAAIAFSIAVISSLVIVYVRRPSHRVFVPLVALFLIAGGVSATSTQRRAPLNTSQLATDARYTARLRLDALVARTSPTVKAQYLSVAISGVRPNTRYRLDVDSLSAESVAGLVVRMGGVGIVPRYATTLRDLGILSPRDSNDTDVFLLHVGLPLRDTLGNELARMKIHGFAHAESATVTASMQALRDTAFTSGGRRYILRGFDREGRRASLQVESVYDLRWRHPIDLLDPIQLRIVWSQTSDTAFVAMSTPAGDAQTFALPGVGSLTTKARLELPERTVRGHPIPSLDGAQLQLLHWRTVSRQQVSANLSCCVRPF